MTTTEQARAVASKISVRNLRARFGQHEALHGMNIDFPANEVTAIIGPSGCGKSTLVRCINRMHEVTPGGSVEGEILFDGTNILGTEVDAVELRRRVGMVFQKPAPFPTMSIEDNVLAGFTLNGIRIPRDRRPKIVERSLRQAALWDEVKDRLEKPGVSLSGGQQQRLCIARAIAVDPEVLLMDEPCSALDPISSAHIEELLLELKASYTIILVTHNMQQAARTSDRTAFLLGGNLIEFDRTVRFFTSPSRTETEDYITGRFG